MAITIMNSGEVLPTAATRNVTADELDILVSKARELSSAREREVKHLQSLLEAIEARLDQ